MDVNTDLELPVTKGGSSKHCRRSAVFALRIVLSNVETCSAYMPNCLSLLRLLGTQAVWPKQVRRAIDVALRGSDDETESVDGDNDDFYADDRPKGMHAWNAYENTIARLYAQNPRLIRDALEANLARLKPGAILKTPANHNTQLLGKLLGLGPEECRLLDFAETRNFGVFCTFLRAIDGLTPNDAFNLVAAAIDAPIAKFKAALRASSPLRSYGLLRVDSTPNDLEDFLRLDDTGQTFLNDEFANAEEMLRVVLKPSPSANLNVQDYPHLAREFGWLSNYLKNAASGRIKGGNILFYGPPGTGKTELARLLAQHADLTCFEVKSADDDGDPVSGKTRLRHFALSQHFLREHEQSLIIFDEIEDVFPDTGSDLSWLFGGKASTSKPDQSKAWLNNQLEQSPVPAIWISNSVSAIDDAFLRRFAFHLEFRTPPKNVRERVIKRCLETAAVSDSLVASLAMDDSLSPAQINQASRFASLCQSIPGKTDESALLHAVKASQSAMGRRLQINSQLATTGGCNFAYLNLDSEVPVDKIEQALRRSLAATLCFHGVPGSGKTSLARHLADSIGRPLMIRRASDLLGMYVGESEKRIAQMFRDAEQEGAVLLLDEADSFLRNRQQAQRSWEVTQVNELLQQMEAFEGIFICTTNLMDDIDDAAMRRFTFKVRFDALRQPQREALFSEIVFGDPGFPLSPALRHPLQQMPTATPGDFSTVRRQEQLLGERFSPENFLRQLGRECALKCDGKSTPIGFVR